MPDQGECPHPMSRRTWGKATVRGETITVEVCLDCDLKILSPFDSERLLRKRTAEKAVRH